MVGVPGRSKACHTCKKRRKCCDQKKPSCGQCMLSRIPCGGYDQPRVFINSGLENGHATSTSSRFKAAAYTMEPSSSSCTQGFTSPELAMTATLNHSLWRTARESKYLDVYWTALLPHGQSFPPEAARYSTTNWSAVVHDLHRKDPIVRVALFANALGLAGQHCGQPSMMMQAWKLYGLSLQVVAQSLLRKRQDWGGILAASGLLATYELLLTADERRSWPPAPAWLRHTSGEMAILLAGGPESFVNGLAHHLFSDHRLHLIYPHIQSRTRCPLGTPEWKTIPWSMHPKSPKDELLDILIEIPGVLEDLNSLHSLSDQPESQTLLHQDLEARCWVYDRQLRSWSTSSGAATVAFVESLITPQAQLDDSSSAVPSSMELAMAHLGITYWSTYSLLSQCLCSLRDTALLKTEQTSLPPRLDAHQYCRKVGLLIPYFQKPEVGAYFISFVGFSSTVAANFLARQDPSGEFAEARGLLTKTFRGEHGAQLRRFLATWPWTTRYETELLGEDKV